MLLCAAPAVFGMDPYEFDEKLQFPEHNNFFMPTTNDLSYVPRNIGKIGGLNDLAAIKKETDKISTKLDQHTVDKKTAAPLTQETSATCDHVFDDTRLQKIISLSVRDITLQALCSVISQQSGVQIVVEPTTTAALRSFKAENQSVGTILRRICLMHKPRLGALFHGDVLQVLPYDQAVLEYDKRQLAQQQLVVIPIKRSHANESFAKKILDGWHKINAHQKDLHSSIHIDLDEHKVFARGLPHEIEEITTFIRELDEPVMQIKIDVILVIAEKNFNFDFGFDWSGIYNRQQSIDASRPPFAFYGLGGTEMDFPTPNKPVTNPPNIQESTNIFVDPLNFALNLFNSGAGFLTGNRASQNTSGAIRLPFIFGGPDLSLARLNVVLNAAEVDAKLKVVSRPSVLTSNNETAKLLIGKSIPLQTTIEDLSVNSTRNITTINFKDTGTMIEVKPTVSADKKSIFLDILIEDSAVTDGSTQTNSSGILVNPPTISMVKVKNRVQLRNGQTTIVGGLSYQANKETRNMVPWFWKLPFFGYLFQATFSSNKDLERYIFITPTIFEEAA